MSENIEECVPAAYEIARERCSALGVDTELALTRNVLLTLERVRIGPDYFDASANRGAAWVIGSRSALRALLSALETLRALEAEGDLTGRLALIEELKAMPSEAVWDSFYMKQGVPVGIEYVNRIREYEKGALSNRGQDDPGVAMEPVRRERISSPRNPSCFQSARMRSRDGLIDQRS